MTTWFCVLNKYNIQVYQDILFILSYTPFFNSCTRMRVFNLLFRPFQIVAMDSFQNGCSQSTNVCNLFSHLFDSLFLLLCCGGTYNSKVNARSYFRILAYIHPRTSQQMHISYNVILLYSGKVSRERVSWINQKYIRFWSEYQLPPGTMTNSSS